MYVPHDYNSNKYQPWDPGDHGWWNIFQFKSNDVAGVSRPMWSLTLDHDDENESMFLRLNGRQGSRQLAFFQPEPKPVTPREWVHLEAYYHSSVKNGRITVWQDGQQIFDVDGIVTSLGGETGTDTRTVWGIGNYTDHVVGDPEGDGQATLYFDDAVVRTADLPGPLLGYLDEDSDETTIFRPGDADMDRDFDQLDLIKVLVSAKYLTGEPATWGEGDWGGSDGPGGANEVGDGVFNQKDIIAALTTGLYFTGPYASRAIGHPPAENTWPTVEASLIGPESSTSSCDARLYVSTCVEGVCRKRPADTRWYNGLPFDNLSVQGGSSVTKVADYAASGEVDLVQLPEPAAWILLSMAICLPLRFAYKR